jgi:hypothetical protein
LLVLPVLPLVLQIKSLHVSVKKFLRRSLTARSGRVIVPTSFVKQSLIILSEFVIVSVK